MQHWLLCLSLGLALALAPAMDPEEAAGPPPEEITVRFLEVPLAFSPSASAAFRFEIVRRGNGAPFLCNNSNACLALACKLDNYSSSNCDSREVSYVSLRDGQHTLEVCIKLSQGVHCERYKWIVDTIFPTAYITAPTFTNASNVLVHITFSEPCVGGGGFRCSSNDCNLLVYGAGHVISSSLEVLQPNLEFSLAVAISTDELYGRLFLVMDRNFCTDVAGNRFKRTSNSTFTLHFDRRNVYVDLRTHIPEKLLQLNGELRNVLATNNAKKLRVYLYFSEPVLNSSTEVLGLIHANDGSLVPINSNSLGNRRFGYLVNNSSSTSIITITCETSSILSRQGTPVSPTEPVTFLFDVRRPSVMLSTSHMKIRERNIPVLIKFTKPVFGFNSSAVMISGGHLLSFREMCKSTYTIQLHADDDVLSIEVLENATGDVAGNKNFASNRLQVRHYAVPAFSSVIFSVTTVTFLATLTASALLTLSTASLISLGAIARPATYLISDPSRNLLRIACHIQVFALTKWLATNLPIEFYEFTRGVQWFIPHLSLPWENEGINPFVETPDSFAGARTDAVEKSKLKVFEPSITRSKTAKADHYLHGWPLTPMEYRLFLEVRQCQGTSFSLAEITSEAFFPMYLQNDDQKPEAQFILDAGNPNGWKSFSRNMFWLAVFGGGLMVLHAGFLFIQKLKRDKSEKQENSGALVFPRFEIFVLFLALPCVCQASATIIRGRSTAGVIVGILLLGVSFLLLMSLILFLSLGITMGKLLQYKEVHQEGQEFHWYREIIRVFLGPGKRGQWTWKGQPNSIRLSQLGPLFEDLRGPPKYMLTQISSHGSAEKLARDRIIASEDETEDAEAPFIQKLFGILRIYYTLLESLRRASLGILAGAYSPTSHSKVPTLVALCFTSFQLFFLALKKPFVKKKVQLVELISISSEVCVFAACFFLLQKEFSEDEEKSLGLFMLSVFIIGFVAQMINEWHALYRQVLLLSATKNSFFSGLKTALLALLLIVLPGNLFTGLKEQLAAAIRGDGDTEVGASPGSGRNQRSPGTSEMPWLRQLRDLAKASFSREEGEVVNDPSSSKSRSGFWTGKRSRSSSVTSSADYKGDLKGRSKSLYKDLEAIFSSK